ncbi:hypothetical protein BU23DRAFT_643403 [Bimuria novae-zelandiae CBS 107.79]|uniref:Uncharacterized protein n=1 Tax=Bimuria novae-zelandiae CBS 107.79 TaxID=1447943 RepID=A0A6A5V6E3_9PLEO|nr:hypothetical protein BU23DRAFT_643403 [Bimuria novae-zelandiae CBS 107.79]
MQEQEEEKKEAALAQQEKGHLFAIRRGEQAARFKAGLEELEAGFIARQQASLVQCPSSSAFSEKLHYLREKAVLDTIKHEKKMDAELERMRRAYSSEQRVVEADEADDYGAPDYSSLRGLLEEEDSVRSEDEEVAFKRPSSYHYGLYRVVYVGHPYNSEEWTPTSSRDFEEARYLSKPLFFSKGSTAASRNLRSSKVDLSKPRSQVPDLAPEVREGVPKRDPVRKYYSELEGE